MGVSAPTLRVGPAFRRGLKGLMSRRAGRGGECRSIQDSLQTLAQSWDALSSPQLPTGQKDKLAHTMVPTLSEAG